jgi:hypothetical protein
MPSTYTTNLGIELPADGELDGVWGDVVNENMDILDRAINGSIALSLTGTSSTLTTSDGALSDGQYKLLVLGGTPSGTHTITIAPSDAQKIYFVRNTTAQSVVFTQGSGGNVTIATGDSAIIYSDGAGAGAAVVNITNDFAMSSVKITGGTIDGTVIGGTTPAAITGTTITATGDVTIADKIIHAGDNTSIRFPANDTVTIETGGAERLRVDSSGNVGVGTASPAARLDVTGASVNALQARFGNVASRGFEISTAASAGGRNDSTSILNAKSDSTVATMVFQTDSTERMRIDSAGNVGIGTSSPTANLQVGGPAGGDRTFQMYSAGVTRGVLSTDGVNGLLNIGCTNDSTTGRIAFRTGAALTERVRIDESGNVGIGTTSPAARLDVTSAAANSLQARFGFVSGRGLEVSTAITGGTNDAASILNAKGASSGTLIFQTDSSERMRIDSSGNVGIGTSSPSDVLTVVPTANNKGLTVDYSAGSARITLTGNAASAQAIAFGDSSSSTSGQLIYDNSVDAMRINTNGAERMRIDSSGNVSIGSSSTPTKLFIQGTASATGGIRLQNSGGNPYSIWSDANSLYVSRGDGSTTALTVLFGGNVGIGNTSPITPLHVTGATVTTGVVYKNQPAQSVESAAATLTIAELLTGIIQYTGALATLTMPTGTNIEGGVPATFPTDMSFDFSVINTGAGVVTLGTATGLTLVGGMTVAAAASGLFRVRKTSTNTYTVYRIS